MLEFARGHQVYGLVLSFDISINFPAIWNDIKKYYDFFPFCLSIDLDGECVRESVARVGCARGWLK